MKKCHIKRVLVKIIYGVYHLQYIYCSQSWTYGLWFHNQPLIFKIMVLSPRTLSGYAWSQHENPHQKFKTTRSKECENALQGFKKTHGSKGPKHESDFPHVIGKFIPHTLQSIPKFTITCFTPLFMYPHALVQIQSFTCYINSISS